MFLLFFNMKNFDSSIWNSENAVDVFENSLVVMELQH